MPLIAACLFVLWSAAGPLQAADSARVREARDLFQAGYDAWEPDLFLKALRVLDKAGRGDSARYWKGVVHFHLAAFYLFNEEGRVRKKEIVPHLDSAAAGLQKLASHEARALLGAVLGLKIKVKPHLTPFTGPRSKRLVERALADAPDNARVQYLAGMVYFYMPGFAGGGAKIALKHLLRADTLFRKERHPWGHSTCLAFTGKAYAENGNPDLAKASFNRALAVNPKEPVALNGLRAIRQKNGEGP